MGRQRLENHLKQIMVLNIKYEDESGTKSALDLLSSVIQKLPILLIEERTETFIYPLSCNSSMIKLKSCRESVSNCIMGILKRLSTTMLLSLHEYLIRWSECRGVEGRQLRQAPIQLFGLFMDARIYFMKKGGRIESFLELVQSMLRIEGLTNDIFAKFIFKS